MFLFQRVIRAIRGWFQRKQPANFTLNMETIRSLQFIAERERRTPEEVADRILIDAMRDHLAQEDNWQRWHSLTPREQEVAALVCLNYTTRQIAAKLHISPETVKTHAEHVLDKFDVPDRNILRLLLSGWDFSGWDRFS
jgi:DNA-binding CsgD family transcriptional regulator